MSWWLDQKEVARFGRWLYHHGYMRPGADMLDYFDDPKSWVEDRLAGDLRARYEAEKKSL